MIMNISNKNTLYRFVSLRSPELSDKQNQPKKIVFYVENKGGYLFQAVANRNNKTKWQAMREAIPAFPYALASEDEVYNLSAVFAKAAYWLSKNKSETPNNIYAKLVGIKPLDFKIEGILWENLFYQIVSQTNFYAKEAIVQMLILQNFIKQRNALSVRKNIIPDIPLYVRAKVILPVLLFEEPQNAESSISNKISGNNINTSFVPNTFGYRRLGIADYKKVVSEICCYDAGEVAHIENVMARELKEKATKSFHQTQITSTESSEIESEKMKDSTSTERFEMQTEIAKIMQEDRQLNANIQVNQSWGTGSLDAGASYASNMSKEESNRQAVTEAKEITQRAMERIVSRVKTEKTVKVTDEFTEENKHRFDNTLGTEHISGVFRFINATYKNQIYNYGKRLMYEFMVPQPSKLHRLAMEKVKLSTTNTNTVLIPLPLDPRTNGYPDFEAINATNYKGLMATYNVSIDTPMANETFINKVFAATKLAQTFEFIDGSFDVQVPDKYATVSAVINFYAKTDGDTGQKHTVAISVGDRAFFVENSTTASISHANIAGMQTSFALNKFKDKVFIGYSLVNYFTFNMSVSIRCELNSEATIDWQKKAFEAVIKGYQEQLRLYNQQFATKDVSGVQILDSNPLFYRQIEQNTLRANCLSYLLDNSLNSVKKFGQLMYSNTPTLPTFEDYHVELNQKTDDYGSFVQFMEQAFEWKLMSYNFYPYYWGNREEWQDLYKFETNDPIFRSFMQSGMARVVVTVKPGFEQAVMLYMATGQIWNGGEIPVLGNPLYVSIVDELSEQEYIVEETWETIVPTSLTVLQKGGVAIDATGLPCNEDCKDAGSPSNLVGNSVTILSTKNP